MRQLIATLAVSAFAAGSVTADEEEFKKLKGTWEITKAERGGENFDDPVGDTVKFDGKKIVVTVGGREMTGTIKIAADKDPKQIDITPDEGERQMLGIYKIDGEMTLCIAPGTRPEKFDSKGDDDRTTMLTLKKKID